MTTIWQRTKRSKRSRGLTPSLPLDLELDAKAALLSHFVWTSLGHGQVKVLLPLLYPPTFTIFLMSCDVANAFKAQEKCGKYERLADK